MLLTALPSEAQFYLSGDDPGRQKWMQIRSDHFRVVYPVGLDSLAREYATALESHYHDVGRSIGFEPNAAYPRKPLPVILRANTSISNGMVTWTPRRMELNTTPDPYCPGAIPWITDLSIHESRHACQMQIGADRPYRFYRILGGELLPGAMAALYGGPFFLEGDAVVTETALTDAGRGRTADFQEYYRVSFDDGDFRDFYSWCWGSYSKYTPDHYVLGYTMLSGLRTIYGRPEFTKDFYNRIRRSHWPYFPFKAFPESVSAVSGLSVQETFLEIARKQNELWQRDAASRAPFMPSDRVTEAEKYFHAVEGGAMASGSLWAIRTGVADSPRLVSIGPSGIVEKARPFASYTSALRSDGKCLYWSESVPDIRWSLDSPSVIRCFDGERMRSITSEGHLFNPSPCSPSILTATEYPLTGGSKVVWIDAGDGSIVRKTKAPGHLQAVETVSLGEEVYASAISDEDGFGIYRVSDWSAVLKAGKVKINHLLSRGGALLFTSDRSGVNELYRLDPSSGEVFQMTCSRFGANDYVFHGDSLYYSVLSTRGRDIFRTALRDLPEKKVDFNDSHVYDSAEILSRQEAKLESLSSFNKQLSEAGDQCPGPEKEMHTSTPERYGKLTNALRIHSWAPIYFDYDQVSGISLDIISESVSPGAIVFFQNDLSSLSGYAGVAFSDAGDIPAVKGNVATSANIHLTYSGLFPVFETTLNISNSRPVKYYSGAVTSGNSLPERALYGEYGDHAGVSGSIRCYVPLSFSSGGWNRGIIPQLSYSITNSVFSSTYRQIRMAGTMGDSPAFSAAEAMTLGRISPWHKLFASLRAYSILSKPSSCLYPKLGIGVEFGFSGRPIAGSAFSSDIFGMVYGYLPGVFPRDGIKLSLLSRQSFSENTTYRFEYYANPLPRGLDGSLMPAVSALYPRQTRFSVDYNLPLITLDSDFDSPYIYIRGLELGLFADAAILSGSAEQSGTLFTTGMSISAVSGNFIWLPYETRIGISLGRNFGNALPLLPGQKRDSLSFFFDIDM